MNYFRTIVNNVGQKYSKIKSNLKKRIEKFIEEDQEEKEQLRKKTMVFTDDHFTNKTKYLREFIYTKEIHSFYFIPWSLILVILILLFSNVITSYVFITFKKKVDNGYLIAIVLMILWYLFFYLTFNTTFEKVTIDKSRNKVQSNKYNFFCRNKQKTYKLSDIDDIELLFKGLRTDTADTSRYYIRMSFKKNNKDDENKHLIFGETISFNTIIEKYQICLGMIKGILVKEVDKTMITDETYTQRK